MKNITGALETCPLSTLSDTLDARPLTTLYAPFIYFTGI